MTKIGIISSFHLKVAMCILMVLDHIYRHFPGMPYAFHQFGRIVMPFFAFLIAQGMVHTRSRQSYIMRLLLFGVATMIGGWMLTFFFDGAVFRYHILISFAIAALIIDAVDQYQRDKKTLWLIMAAVLAGVALFFEGAWLVTVPVLIFYYLRSRPLLMYAAYAASVFPLVWLMEIVLSLIRGRDIALTSQWLMIFSIIPIMLYNGKRGIKTSGRRGFFAKYAFYIFYPAHLWILFLVSNLMFGR